MIVFVVGGFEELVIICILRHVTRGKVNISPFPVVLAGPQGECNTFCCPRGQISKETVAPALQRQDAIVAPMPLAHLLGFFQRCAAEGLIVADLTQDHDLAFSAGDSRLVEFER